ncbi:hypothetical protein B296_00031554, partial [Ensete ventricosum]
KTETRRKIIGGSRKAYRDGISPTFARRFVEGIGKLAGNMPGDHQKKTGRLTARMSEAIGLAGQAHLWEQNNA